MTDVAPVGSEIDQALVHGFIRVHGRRPELRELERYRDGRSGVVRRRPRRTRAVARLIARLIVRL